MGVASVVPGRQAVCVEARYSSRSATNSRGGLSSSTVLHAAIKGNFGVIAAQKLWQVFGESAWREVVR